MICRLSVVLAVFNMFFMCLCFFCVMDYWGSDLLFKKDF